MRRLTQPQPVTTYRREPPYRGASDEITVCASCAEDYPTEDYEGGEVYEWWCEDCEVPCPLPGRS